MKTEWQENIWEQFFSDPRLSMILEDAEMVDSDQDSNLDGSSENEEPEQEQGASAGGSSIDLEQLAADFQQGDIDQDELIKLYQSGKISKEDVQQIVAQVEGEEPQDEEELLSQQIDQTNDMFVKFALYDKIIELTEKLDYFKENFDDTQSSIYERVLQLGEFLNILSSLIFSIETPVSYQMYGSILLQLTELFSEYNQQEQAEDHVEDKQDAAQDAEEKRKRENERSTSEDIDSHLENPEVSSQTSTQDVSVNDINNYSA